MGSFDWGRNWKKTVLPGTELTDVTEAEEGAIAELLDIAESTVVINK
ncbi:hypothetical protein [Streptomyces sp. NPDC046261]